MNKLVIGIPILIGILIGAMIMVGVFNSGNEAKVVEQEKVTYSAKVCVSKNGELIECSSNVLTTTGMDAIKNILGQNTDYSDFTSIALSDSTAPADDDGTLEPTILGGGLAPADGTYTSVGTGKWHVNHTFTADAHYSGVRLSGLFNDTATSLELAENSFTSTNLEANDQLTVSWQLNVTGA